VRFIAKSATTIKVVRKTTGNRKALDSFDSAVNCNRCFNYSVLFRADDANGRYVFSNGSVYDGGFKDGQFHGPGRLHFPGKGTFVGEWSQGKMVQGSYVFADGLEFAAKEWDYLLESDRRFWSEIQEGILGGDCVQLTNRDPPPEIPLGCYDVGDGYYNPRTRQVYSYRGDVLRSANEQEEQWALNTCRVNEEIDYLAIGVVRPPETK
jgi:hypothetical protein